MTGLDVVTTPELVTAYRLWRVMPFHRLDGSSTVRLCAMGTYGNPKIWEPRQRTTASCSDYESHHEAPWPDHVCGIWALKDPAQAKKRLVEWTSNYTSGEPVGFAIGEVSLWGRVIEHADGWRAQHAYPYAVVIEAPDERTADVVRREYAIDVEWGGPAMFETARRKLEAKHAAADAEEQARKRELQKARRELAQIQKKLAETSEERRAREQRERDEKFEAKKQKEIKALRALPPVPDISDLTVDELLVAFVSAIAVRHEQVGWHRAGLHPWHVSDVCESVLFRRGVLPPLACWGESRRGYNEAQARVREIMGQARDEGMLEYGLPFEARHAHSSTGEWFMSRKGLARVIALNSGVGVDWDTCGVKEAKKMEIDVTRAARRLQRRQRPLFVEEVEVLQPQWMNERRAAERQGRRALRVWLAERRKHDQPAMLWFTDDEVAAAVTKMREATSREIMERLAPGDRLKGEVARFSYQFVRLAREGRLIRIDAKPPRWASAA